MAELTSERYSGYELERQIATGNFSVVWRAGSDDGSQVVVKIATAEVGARMLRAEWRVLGDQRLPGIVPLLGFGELPRPHVVMPFVGRWTLRDLFEGAAHPRQRERLRRLGQLRDGKDGVETIKVGEAGRWAVGLSVQQEIITGTRQGRFFRLRKLLGVLHAVRVLHRRGLVHGDLKPENVLIAARDGRCKLSDFGLAQELQAFRREQRLDHSMHSEEGLIGGTLAYLPPEGVKGGEPSQAGDVYALGVMLHEALLFRRPDKAAGPGALEGVPRPLLPVLDRALAYDPAERYPNATELTLALRQALITVEASREIRMPGPAPPLGGSALDRFCGICLLLSYLGAVMAALVLLPPAALGIALVLGVHMFVWDGLQIQALRRRWQDVAER